MFKLKNYQPTNHSLHSYTESHHNCPYCQCQNSSNRTFSPTSHQYPPKYQQTFVPKVNQTPYTNHMIFSFAPHLDKINGSAVFSTTQPTSPPKRNKSIIFNYISPPKQKRNNSAQAKFNTKQFKNQRFPFIGNEERNNVVKNEKNDYPKQYIMTNEMTPQKPKILKLNKMKSLDRLKLSTQNGSNYINLQNCSQPESKNHYIRDHVQQNFRTPINLLKEPRYPSKNNLNHQNHHQNIYVQQQSMKKTAPLSNELLIQQKNPYSYNPNTHNKNSTSDISEDKKKLFAEKEGFMSKLLQVQSEQYERQIASSITMELELNYDYYYPIQDSDRSISAIMEL